MVRQLAAMESVTTPVFGGFCPYWTSLGGMVVVADTAEEMFSALPAERRVIDPVAVLELLQFNYMLGERTLVQGVNRMPWRATLWGSGRIERRAPLAHGDRKIDAGEAGGELRRLLEEELLRVTSGRKRVFLLTTGGLDSRIVAGVMKRIESRIGARIVCCTWGSAMSRDVAYARRIAEWHQWDFVHIPFDESICWPNIERGAVWGGSEVAGTHLHGMEWFAHAERDDLVIAASFGDGIGRGEFSSAHLMSLKVPVIGNTWNLVHSQVAGAAMMQAEQDLRIAWDGEADTRPHVRCELDQQENYMRRMIAHAMDFIRQYCGLHQAFTSDRVVGYMWSLTPECRVDDIYYAVLRDLDARLYSLPWARTGRAPDGSVETNEALTQHYHQYARWCHGPLRSQLEELFFSDGLRRLGFLDATAMRSLWKYFLLEPNVYELVIKVCSVELSRRRFELRGCRRPTPWQDEVRDVLRRGAKSLSRHISQ